MKAHRHCLAGSPSSRWNVVVNNTPGGVFSASPNLTDGTVYMDELLNLLVTKYGNASTPNGIKGYDLDNEPDLWPRLIPASSGPADLCRNSFEINGARPDSEADGPARRGPRSGVIRKQWLFHVPKRSRLGIDPDRNARLPLVSRLLSRPDEQGFDCSGNAPARCPRPPPLQRRRRRHSQ